MWGVHMSQGGGERESRISGPPGRNFDPLFKPHLHFLSLNILPHSFFYDSVDVRSPPPFPPNTVGTWIHELPEFVLPHVKPWVSKGRQIVMDRHHCNHGNLFVNPKNGTPFDRRRFSEFLVDTTKEATTFEKLGSQKLRRIFAAGTPLQP